MKSKRFQGRKKLTLGCVALGCVIALIFTGWLLPKIKRQLAIDKCLDAGGSYNYDTKTCIQFSVNTDPVR